MERIGQSIFLHFCYTLGIVFFIYLCKFCWSSSWRNLSSLLSAAREVDAIITPVLRIIIEHIRVVFAYHSAYPLIFDSPIID